MTMDEQNILELIDSPVLGSMLAYAVLYIRKIIKSVKIVTTQLDRVQAKLTYVEELMEKNIK